ncbi:DUF4183 domain-containing protein [Guptibacillus hwajinpoensis]|uniref:DUF4183 domain-containing protein n=1 Tax=Guptibacillus hwajinpoensis TaxID=208199 RepID=UPI001CD52EBF|nr:DUF4183 domain-containing protein [Pseudalkalibacillus hwajinpoensis]MCA0990316.1 DUF4183 domain-containing protein [Pseudalkalibacillus hwajinpoensis]
MTKKYCGLNDLSLPEVSYPEVTSHVIRKKLPKKVIVHEYFAFAKEGQRIYTDQNAVEGYPKQRILNPCDVSYINLFINGVLQPELNYRINEGVLVLLTEDVPICGATIILQMLEL